MRAVTMVYAVLMAGCAAGVASADELSSGKDLGATIALNGFPCDQVVDSKRNSDSDYLATCKDGNRYRVFVDAHGRVVVQKQ